MKILFLLSVFFLNTLYAAEYNKSTDFSLRDSDPDVLEIGSNSGPDTNRDYDRGKNINNIVSAKEVVGRVEKVRLYPGGMVLKARIDTGAQISSLHVTSTELIFRNGEEWINFTVTNLKGKKANFERKIHRISTIKRHHDEVQQRIVVLLGVCLGNTYRETEINLFDRGGLNYPLLIGRQLLSGNFIVDPAQLFSKKPDCKEVPK